MESRWYVKAVYRETMIVINGEPPWPGFVIGRLLAIFIEVCDLDGDRTVTMRDITMAAVAFRTKPVDARWNLVADLAEPYGEINIVDVGMVAKDYGKTAPQLFQKLRQRNLNTCWSPFGIDRRIDRSCRKCSLHHLTLPTGARYKAISSSPPTPTIDR